MKHPCFELDEFKMVNYDKSPHMFNSQLKDAPNGNGVVLTILYMNAEDDTKLGWGMRLKHCPECGKKLT